MIKKNEQKNDDKDRVCTREYQLDQLGQFAWWKHFQSVAVEKVTDCTYHYVFRR